jgi:hypothetical protein
MVYFSAWSLVAELVFYLVNECVYFFLIVFIYSSICARAFVSILSEYFGARAFEVTFHQLSGIEPTSAESLYPLDSQNPNLGFDMTSISTIHFAHL